MHHCHRKFVEVQTNKKKTKFTPRSTIKDHHWGHSAEPLTRLVLYFAVCILLMSFSLNQREFFIFVYFL